MRANSGEFNRLVDELLSVLDAEAELVDKSLACLDRMRGCVIKRDETGLGQLLAKIQSEADVYTTQEGKRRAVCEKLAEVVGLSADEVSLSRLQQLRKEADGFELSADRSAAVSERRQTLQKSIARLRAEQAATAALLSECARLNRLMLSGIFEDRPGADTYSAEGKARRDGQPNFMSARI